MNPEPPFPPDSSIVSAMPAKLPSVLYHYCPIEAFKAILLSGHVWLSDASHMNDTTEGKWFNEIFELHFRTSQQKWREANHMFHDHKISKNTFYIASFSEQSDQLSQWRAYANNGQGINIGFNFGEFSLPSQLTFNNVFFAESRGCTIDRVVYDTESQLEAIRRVLVFHDYLLSLSTGYYVYEGRFTNGIYCLSYLSKLLKHPGFYEENEWRIVYDGTSDYKGIEIDKTIRHRLRGDTKIGYFEFNFRSISNPIYEVILGPTCILSIEETKQLLIDSDYQGVQVRRSSVPYR